MSIAEHPDLEISVDFGLQNWYVGTRAYQRTTKVVSMELFTEILAYSVALLMIILALMPGLRETVDLEP